MTGFSVDPIALRTLVDYWPVLVAGALAAAWLVIKRMRRSRPFPRVWALTSAVAAVLMSVALWVEPFLATRLVNGTFGEGSHAESSRQLLAHFQRSWPLAVGLVSVELALVAHPRSSALAAVLVAAAGFLASWMAAMWLFTTIHSPFVFRLLAVGGGLGVVASIAGFTTARALWMAIGRWIWREGRRSSGRSVARQP